MDGDSGDEGNDELTCVRSDKSDLLFSYTALKYILFCVCSLDILQSFCSN